MISEQAEHHQRQNYGVPELSSERQETSDSRVHITAKGKEGKVLRKKLAIALGLKPNSSSTTSQSEGEDVQNVVDVFRKQVRKTVDTRSRNFPRTVQERQQENLDKRSLIIRKTVRKTTDTSSELLEEEFEDYDDIDEQETTAETVSPKRSKEQYSMTGEKLETFDHERSHESREKRMKERKNTKMGSLIEFWNKDMDEEEKYPTMQKMKWGHSREMTENKSGKRLLRKMENKDGGEITSKSQSWDLETRNSRYKVLNKASTIEEPKEFDSSSKSNVSNANALTTEEIFSSYGEQSEKVPSDVIKEISPSESVKLLREKIRKNSKARQVRRSSRGDHDLEESRDNQNAGKIASMSEIQSSTSELQESSAVASGNRDNLYDQFSSKIPRRSLESQGSVIPENQSLQEGDGRNAVQEENRLNSKTKTVQKSKIPRRKSQNASDEMGQTQRVRFQFDETKEQMADAHSGAGVIQWSDKLSKSVSKREGVQSGKVSLESPRQKRNPSAHLGQLLRKVSKKTDSIKTSATAEATNTHHVTSSASTEKITKSVRQFDFDAFEAELNELKVSVFKTYEEFKEIKSMALGVEEELNDLKSIYGVSYFCMYGN